MKPVLVITFLLLCAALLQGMPTSSRGRCLCRGKLQPDVNMKKVAEFHYHRPTPSCAVEELVLIFKRSGKTACLDLNSHRGRNIKEAIMKKKK
ncbi:hypothetical protein JRQ81_016987 [Phrynocephalus forsythii]|uniref:Chemokine interleukin-8-like domain-containing protein n=1 Tax=Phrynocephalus forsythii TaxID=171643 RepID=A0A9Q0XU56_9SAUR|nr:hypothetical protein JRQ81_016987 [Phrynocephalus forsythii]